MLAEFVAALFLAHRVAPEHTLPVAVAAVRASDEFDIPAEVILGVISAESSGRPDARNKGCLGLMQVNRRVWHDTLTDAGIIGGHEDYFRLESAVRAGAFILRHYLDRSGGDMKKALRRYSGGGGRRYVEKCLRFQKGGRE